MKQCNHLMMAGLFVCTTLALSNCTSQEKEKSTAMSSDTSSMPAKAEQDPAALKATVQSMETAWSEADDRRDVNALAGFYADDAVSFNNNAPMLVGNAAIRKDIEESMAKRVKGTTTRYDVQDVFGCDKYVTETGLTTRKDSTGKVIYKGKYMAIWENRGGKWVCIRDIGNDDEKRKP